MRRKVTLGMILAYAFIAAPFVLPHYAHQVWDWRDYAAITGLILLLWWLLSPSRGSGDAAAMSANRHEDASKGFAFRLGKSLNRIRRGTRGSA